MAIIQLPNGETLEVPDDWEEKQVQSAVDSIMGKPAEEPAERGIVSKAAELALQRPFEVLTSPFSAAYHGFWKGSEEFGKLMGG